MPSRRVVGVYAGLTQPSHDRDDEPRDFRGLRVLGSSERLADLFGANCDPSGFLILQIAARLFFENRFKLHITMIAIFNIPTQYKVTVNIIFFGFFNLGAVNIIDYYLFFQLELVRIGIQK